MKVIVIATLLAAAAAQQLPSVLLARPGTFPGGQVLTSGGVSQTSNFDQSQQFQGGQVFTIGGVSQTNNFDQSQQFQGGQVFTSGGVSQTDNFDQSQQFQGQNNQFQSGFTTVTQGQNTQFVSGSSFDDQQQNTQILSGSPFVQQQNNQFQSSSSLSGQNGAFQSGLSFGNQGQNQIQSGVSVLLQGNSNQGQVTSNQFQTTGQLQLGGEASAIVNGQFEPLNLPAGASLLLGSVDTSFQCADRPYGYYADQGNDCRVFHICNPYLFEDGRIETYQYSFLCGEGTQFDQKEFTCAEQASALPCSEAPNFFFRNEAFGKVNEQF